MYYKTSRLYMTTVMNERYPCLNGRPSDSFATVQRMGLAKCGFHPDEGSNATADVVCATLAVESSGEQRDRKGRGPPATTGGAKKHLTLQHLSCSRTGDSNKLRSTGMLKSTVRRCPSQGSRSDDVPTEASSQIDDLEERFDGNPSSPSKPYPTSPTVTSIAADSIRTRRENYFKTLIATRLASEQRASRNNSEPLLYGEDLMNLFDGNSNSKGRRSLPMRKKPIYIPPTTLDTEPSVLQSRRSPSRQPLRSPQKGTRKAISSEPGRVPFVIYLTPSEPSSSSLSCESLLEGYCSSPASLQPTR